MKEPLSAAASAKMAASSGLGQVGMDGAGLGEVDEAEVDNSEAGGFFAAWGRDGRPADPLRPRGAEGGTHSTRTMPAAAP